MHFDRNWIEQPDEATAKEPVVRPFADRSDSSSVPGHKNKEGRQQVLQSKISCCEKAPKERRGSMRMPIERDVSYKVRGLTAGSGKTVNISSGGVLFTTESPLLEGAEVELAISWPALLNNVTRIKLVVNGRLTRSDGTRAAMHIEKYEFKTCCVKNGITKLFDFGGWEGGAPKGSLLSHK